MMNFSNRTAFLLLKKQQHLFTKIFNFFQNDACKKLSRLSIGL